MSVNGIGITVRGIVGDRHSGETMEVGARQKDYAAPGTQLTNFRQISIVSKEELAVIANRMGIEEVTGSDVGANIVLEGVHQLTSFPAGVNGVLRFHDSGVVLFSTGENEPCIGPGRAIARRLGDAELATKFAKAAKHARGITAMVAQLGNGTHIRAGEQVSLFYPDWIGWDPLTGR